MAEGARSRNADAWALVEEAWRLFRNAKAAEDKARALTSIRSTLKLAERQYGPSERLLVELDKLIAAARRQFGSMKGTPNRGATRALGSWRAAVAARLETRLVPGGPVKITLYMSRMGDPPGTVRSLEPPHELIPEPPGTIHLEWPKPPHLVRFDPDEASSENGRTT